ncbi:MAG: hypothetical protein KDD64_12365 [Bdellovibrionales bacterium]|nr:hypothetical protein [Bdellovibrionales bacterium]
MKRFLVFIALSLSLLALSGCQKYKREVGLEGKSAPPADASAPQYDLRFDPNSSPSKG